MQTHSSAEPRTLLMSCAPAHLICVEDGWMRLNKLKIGAATALAGVSLASGALLLGAPWASAQTPPVQPTPQRQPGTPGQGQQGQQGGRGQGGSGQHKDSDCPRDANGNMLPHGTGPSGSTGPTGGSGATPNGGNGTRPPRNGTPGSGNPGGTPGGSGQSVPGGTNFRGSTGSSFSS